MNHKKLSPFIVKVPVLGNFPYNILYFELIILCTCIITNPNFESTSPKLQRR